MNTDPFDRYLRGELTLDEIEAAYERIMESDEAANVAEALGLDPREWTAFAQGVWFDELAAWRASGWPQPCEKCGQTIQFEDFNWLAQEQAPGRHALVHVNCPRI